MKITLSKKQWQNIGKQAGWTKSAQSDTSGYDNIANILLNEKLPHDILDIKGNIVQPANKYFNKTDLLRLIKSFSDYGDIVFPNDKIKNMIVKRLK